MTGALDDRDPDSAPTRLEPKELAAIVAERERSEAVTAGGSITSKGSTDPETVAAPLDPGKNSEPRTIGSSTQATTVATPLDALHLEEIRRTRAFTRIVIPFALFLMALLPFIGGDPVARWVVAAAMTTIAGSGIVLTIVMREDAGYTVPRVMVFGIICVVAGYAGIYFFGIFSPAATIMPFGLYFFSVGQSYRGTLTIYLMCAACELGIGGAIITGLIQDRGLVRAVGLSSFTQLAIVALVEVTFFATFLVARASRKAVLHAIEEHDRAVRGLAQREELLKEAKLDLERALEAGGLGRFTDEVLGSYRLGSIIGRGGMGEVYEAVNVATQALAAVKLLHGHALGEPDHVRRFLREARIVASFDVPNVVKVLEVGGLEARVPFIAMERLRGQDLAEVLREHRRLSVQKVLTMVREVGRGLDAARKGGIVHRDLKPRNLFYADLGMGKSVWKILDFGVSRLLADQATLTHDQVLGTPSYMAPEQVKGSKNLDYRADLYSLGVICYRSLTGRPAFAGDEMAEILYKVLNSMPPRPSRAARLTDDVDHVLAIALAKDPEARFGSAAELADALEAASRGELPQPLRARAEGLLLALPWAEG